MKTFKQFLEGKLPDGMYPTPMVQLSLGWAFRHKKFATWHKLYKKHIDDYYDSMKEFRAAGGKPYSRSWSEMVGYHVQNTNYDGEKGVNAFWAAISKKFKITPEDLNWKPGQPI
jgi:hypothetical protein